MQYVETLTDLLCYRAQRSPNKMAYTFLRDGETEEASFSFSELDQQARIIAAELQQSAFFGYLYAGMVAVSAYPPRRN